MNNILLDSDGLIADFIGAAIKRLNARFDLKLTQEQWVSYDHYKTLGISSTAFWGAIDDYQFWANEIQPYPWAKNILLWAKNNFGKDNWFVATSPSSNSACLNGKADWFRKHFRIPSEKLMLGSAKHLMARPTNVLIDDYEKNVNTFKAHDGKGILFPQYWNEAKTPPKEPVLYLSEQLIALGRGNENSQRKEP